MEPIARFFGAFRVGGAEHNVLIWGNPKDATTNWRTLIPQEDRHPNCLEVVLQGLQSVACLGALSVAKRHDASTLSTQPPQACTALAHSRAGAPAPAQTAPICPTF